MEFTIKYRLHCCRPCEKYGDTKEETIIRSNGTILVCQYDHHGPNGYYRLINRAVGSADPKTVRNLYKKLYDLIRFRVEYSSVIMDTDAEIVLKEPGLKVSADDSTSDGERFKSSLIELFIKHHNLR